MCSECVKREIISLLSVVFQAHKSQYIKMRHGDIIGISSVLIASRLKSFNIIIF